jgi:hypothetical protein
VGRNLLARANTGGITMAPLTGSHEQLPERFRASASTAFAMSALRSIVIETSPKFRTVSVDLMRTKIEHVRR